jgi:hypothetical protein
MIFILASARGSRAGFGGPAEIFGLHRCLQPEKKVRDGEDALARSPRRPLLQNEQTLRVLSCAIFRTMMLPVAANGN